MMEQLLLPGITLHWHEYGPRVYVSLIERIGLPAITRRAFGMCAIIDQARGERRNAKDTSNDERLMKLVKLQHQSCRK